MTAMVLLSSWMESQVELWLPTRFEGYDVSSFGRVRSVRRNNRIARGSKDRYGYLFVETRHINGRRNRFWVHREVALTFLVNPDDLPEVNHRTGIKDDNRLDNFEWVTKSGNVQHATDIGLRDNAIMRGERNSHATITEDEVRSIRRRHASGESFNSIAKNYSRGTLKHLLAGRSWKHVQ